MKKTALALSLMSVFAFSAHAETPAAIPTPPAIPAMPKMPEMPKPTMPIPAGTTEHKVDDSGMMRMLMKAPDNSTPATKAFVETNAKMHHGMAIEFSDNADVDFVKGMIPHHQGAVDMAKIVLQYGKDPEIKKFAESIIKAQSTEIDFMNAWLKKHPK